MLIPNSGYKEIQQAEKTGITLTTNTLLKDEVVFSINTNLETYQEISNKEYFFSFHQNRNFKGLKIMFSDDKLSTNVKIKKNALFPGLNIVTIFNEKYHPILERMIMIFNHQGIKRKRIKAEIEKSLVDSLKIKITPTNHLDSLSRVSISILPKNTISYTPTHNTLSAFLLKPYIKSPLEEAGYYFTAKNRRRREYDLDLLLLTQGWSKYDWKNIYNFIPKQNYKHQTGFTISGTVLKRNDKKHNQLFVRSNDINIFELTDIDKENNFKIENVFIIDSSKISIGLINEKNDKIKKSSFSASILPFKITNQFYK